MQLLSLFGRVLFAAIFIFSAWEAFQELLTDDEVPTFKEFGTLLSRVDEFLNTKLGLAISDVPVKFASYLLWFKFMGAGILFVLNYNTGALLLLLQLAFTTPIIFDFYNCKRGSPEFGVLLRGFLQQLAHVGALLFFIGMENSITKRGQKIQKTKTG